MIPYGKQNISEDDIKAVTDVLRSDYLTQGPEVEKFERRFAESVGAQYAAAVHSCTAALHISYMALGLQEGQIVWTVPNTFVATANAALYCNARVEFVDINPDTYLMCPKALEAKLIEAQKNNCLPDIVVPVHFSGASCDMAAIFALSETYDFKIVEDAAHCTGASYRTEKVGSCTYSDMACFSFHPVKIITSGEGGIVTTNNKDVYEKLLMARTHGITKSSDLMEDSTQPAWYFEQQFLGYHYRMTDMQCALVGSQMNRLDQFVKARTSLAARYDSKLATLPVTLPQLANDVISSWHLYVIRLANNKMRDFVFQYLRDKEIGVNLHYIPVHLHPHYKRLGFEYGQYPASEAYYHTALTLPLYPNLSEAEQDYVCDMLSESLDNF